MYFFLDIELFLIKCTKYFFLTYICVLHFNSKIMDLNRDILAENLYFRRDVYILIHQQNRRNKSNFSCACEIYRIDRVEYLCNRACHRIRNDVNMRNYETIKRNERRKDVLFLLVSHRLPHLIFESSVRIPLNELSSDSGRESFIKRRMINQSANHVPCY